MQAVLGSVFLCIGLFMDFSSAGDALRAWALFNGSLLPELSGFSQVYDLRKSCGMVLLSHIKSLTFCPKSNLPALKKKKKMAVDFCSYFQNNNKNLEVVFDESIGFSLESTNGSLGARDKLSFCLHCVFVSFALRHALLSSP